MIKTVVFQCARSHKSLQTKNDSTVLLLKLNIALENVVEPQVNGAILQALLVHRLVVESEAVRNYRP